jgi:surface antigen
MSYALSWPGLTQDDIERMNAAGARLYEGRSIGTVERWRSPDSKDAGEVKLIRSFNSHGMPCRTLDHTIRFETQRDSPSHYIINWCKIPDDGWKIVEVAPPR